MDISVIIPVYNGEKTIEKLFEGINENLKPVGSFEVLFVYDCGSDNSWEILKRFQKKYPQKIRIFKLNKNYGQHNATLFGISEAAGDLIITMDDDLQHDPDYLPHLIKEQKTLNSNVIYGKFIDSKHSFFRKIASRILLRLLKVLIPGLGYYSSFRLLKKEVAQKITLLKSSYTFIDARLRTVTSDFGFLEIDHRENTDRKSTYNFFKLAFHAIQIILEYSRIIIWLFVISFSLILIAFILRFFLVAWHGMQTGIFISGMILLFAGISGELLYRWKVKTNSLPVIAVERY